MNNTKTPSDDNRSNAALPVNGGPTAGYLTTHQFSVAVGVRAETVRRWCRSGRLKAAGETPTGQYRFHPRQVAEALGVESSQSETRAAGAGPVTQALAAQIRNDLLREIRERRNRAG